MKKFTVNEKQTLKTFTDNVYPQGSFAFPRLLRARDIRVNGKKTGENILLREGDEVVYYTTLREESVPAYETVYEDENVLVADKYAGVNSEALYFALSQKGETYFIHRLDRNTAGLMIFAKNKRAEAELLRAFRERRVQKIYLALCFGKFAKGVDMLCGYLVKDEKAARVRVYSKPREGAEKIETEYCVLNGDGELSMVEIVLHSGKTHQIRAHMAFIGHPVAGDEKYGDEARNKKYGVKRQLLVAKTLRLQTERGARLFKRAKFFLAVRAGIEKQLPECSKNDIIGSILS